MEEGINSGRSTGIMSQTDPLEPSGDDEKKSSQSKCNQHGSPTQAVSQNFSRNSRRKSHRDNKSQPVSQPARIKADRPAAGFIHTLKDRQDVFHSYKPERQRDQNQEETVNIIASNRSLSGETVGEAQSLFILSSRLSRNQKEAFKTIDSIPDFADMTTLDF